VSLSRAKLILISSAKPIQPFPRKTRGEEGGEKECCFAHIKKEKEKKSSNCLIESCGAIMLRNRIYGDKVPRRPRMFLADSCLFLAAIFSEDFSLPPVSPPQPLVLSIPLVAQPHAGTGACALTAVRDM